MTNPKLYGSCLNHSNTLSIHAGIVSVKNETIEFQPFTKISFMEFMAFSVNEPISSPIFLNHSSIGSKADTILSQIELNQAEI